MRVIYMHPGGNIESLGLVSTVSISNNIVIIGSQKGIHEKSERSILFYYSELVYCMQSVKAKQMWACHFLFLIYFIFTGFKQIT